MGEYGYGDYVAYKMKMNAIAFVVIVSGSILYFSGKAIFDTVFKIMVDTINIDWVNYGVSFSVTVWALICMIWAGYILYKDGK